MNPVIIIPSYWTSRERSHALDDAIYDHATFISDPKPQLDACLASLDNAHGVLSVIVLLVAERSCESQARVRVEGICRAHPRLSTRVIGTREGDAIAHAVSEMAPRLEVPPVALRGYGPIRNMGLAVAAILGHDIVIFLDDDEVALDDDFLIDALYGLGLSTRQGLPIVAKTGYYLDRDGSPYADLKPPRWRDRPWSKREEFNALMSRLLTNKRISRTSYVCGGCFAIVSDAFRKVAFDPFIPRGEDLDYLFNLRMNGLDVWFDTQWRVRHLPPETPSHASRFLQDVCRWEYEHQKLEAINVAIGLRHVTAESLEPYPGSWVGGTAGGRATRTAWRRLILGPERRAYARLLLGGHRRLRAWATDHARSYLIFQTYWPRIMDMLWDNTSLAKTVTSQTTAPSASHDEGSLCKDGDMWEMAGEESPHDGEQMKG